MLLDKMLKLNRIGQQIRNASYAWLSSMKSCKNLEIQLCLKTLLASLMLLLTFCMSFMGLGIHLVLILIVVFVKFIDLICQNLVEMAIQFTTKQEKY